MTINEFESGFSEATIKVMAALNDLDKSVADTIRTSGAGNDFATALQFKFQEAKDLLLKKHEDYGPTNISRAPGGALNGLRVRMHDKQARINHLMDSKVSPKNESLRDSFIDLANYAIIALMVIDGDWPEK
jgi:hypothetical protein